MLPESFPGIKFNTEGVCQFCGNYKGTERREKKKREYRNKFEELVRTYKGRGCYDAIAGYSGGKDSTYVLSLLKEEYDLNILAITFDNGFLPEQTHRNIRNVVEALGVDHIFLKPRFDVLSKIFRVCSENNIYSSATVSRASTICTSCISIVKFSTLRTALEKNIPFVVYGWSPGQIPLNSSIMKNNPQLLKPMQNALFRPLYDCAGEALRPYFLEDKHFTSSFWFPYNVGPLAFLDYNEGDVLRKAGRLGWKKPRGLDANTTNCLLNSYANTIHKEKYHFHPYVFELAGLVREGYLERSAALAKLNQKDNPEILRLVKTKLGLNQ